MKKICFLALFLCLTIFQAQEIKEIYILDHGKKAILNLMVGNTRLSIDTDGNILHLNSNGSAKEVLTNIGSVTYQKDAEIDYADPELRTDFNTNIEYYDDFHDYSSGKLKSLNGIKFEYYNDFYSYQKGKIQHIGDLKFTYYNDFHDYQTGKIESIGKVTFTYFNDFYPYKAGKLKSIKGNSQNINITLIND
ncbi:MAG: hypothetical protein K0M56_08260 [Kaistella sp.]|nr:hypothetical protein [Kaistella sp.]